MATLTINLPPEVEEQVKLGMKAAALGLGSAGEAAQHPDVDWPDIEKAIIRYINQQVRVASRELAEEQMRRSLEQAPNIIAVADPRERELPTPPIPPTPTQ